MPLLWLSQHVQSLLLPVALSGTGKRGIKIARVIVSLSHLLLANDRKLTVDRHATRSRMIKKHPPSSLQIGRRADFLLAAILT
jgi:ABC-type ATPase involved in cell division